MLGYFFISLLFLPCINKSDNDDDDDVSVIAGCPGQEPVVIF